MLRSFAQAIDRQRQAVEHVPVLAASRAGLFEAARALDEAEVAAIAMTVDDAAAEVPMFARAAQAVRWVLGRQARPDEVQALKADPQNSVANAQFQLCAELTAILFSNEEAELLRRRGRAALSAAA